MREPKVYPELRARLNRNREHQREMRALRERIEQWEAEAQRCTANYGPGAPSGGAGDRRAELVARIVDAQRELEAYIQPMAEAEGEILRLIRLVPDERYRTLLTLRYVDCLPWAEVAERMHYCGDYVRDLHYRALEQLNALLQN